MPKQMLSAALLLTIAQAWVPLVQIGRVDHDTRDLTFGPGGYARYATDPVYVAGRSDARHDWPYVIPGPADAWANAREHAFEIRFALDAVPVGASLRVRADFAETHPASPPRLRLSVNGSSIAEWDAPKGHGDDGLMGKPKTGNPSEWTVVVPADKLKVGANKLELRSISGSWAVFDAVSVEGRALQLADLRPSMEVQATRPGQTLVNTPKGPARELSVRVVNTGAATQGTLTTGTTVQPVALPTGATDLHLECAIPRSARSLTVHLAATNGLSADATVKLQPVRPWRIFLLPEGHVDIGYTHPQNVVAEIHAQNIRDALKLIEETKNRPVGERYRWNAETEWAVEHYLSTADANARLRLGRAMSNGELGVSAAYANMLYGLCRPEEMLRAFTVSSVPRKSWQTATLSDVPGVPWGLVTALSEARVQNLVYWPNAGDVMRERIENRPCWWQGRDGQSRVFFWPMYPYSQGTGLKGVLHMNGAWFPGRPHAVKTNTPSEHFLGDWLPGELDRLAPWYPYSIVGLPWALWDNGPLDLDVPEAVRLWNRRYASPKIEIVSIDEACRTFLREYGSKLPTVAGDFGPQWEDGAASSAYETALNRAAAERLAQAEIAWSSTAPARFPRDRVDKAWKDVLLYSEHTWGAADSWDNPEGENQRRQWAVKSGFARNAAKESADLLRDAIGTSPGKPFEVVNTSARSRDGLVEVEGIGSIEDSTGKAVPSQVLHDGHTAFMARGVPALGCRRYRLLAGRGGRAVRTGTTIDDGLYRVSADPASGDVSIRKNGVELAAKGFAQYLYLKGSDPSKVSGLRDVRVETLESGPLVWTLRVTGHGDGANGDVVRTVQLVKGIDAVDITLRLDKSKVRDKEIAFMSLPFDLERPTVNIEGPWAPFDPARQLVKGANDQFFTVNRWVQLQSGAKGVTVVSPDTPILVQGRPSAARLGDTQTYDPHSPNLQFQIAQNHWYTNYLAYQTGPITARYTVRGDDSYDPGSSSRLAEDVVRPLVVGGRKLSLPFAVQGDVELSTIRPARKGGWIVRVYGASGKATKVRIAGRGMDVYTSDGRENRGARVSGAAVVPGFGVRTFLVIRR